MSRGRSGTEAERDGTSDEAVRCANCTIAIESDAVERDGRAYCCEGCADGGPCIC